MWRSGIHFDCEIIDLMMERPPVRQSPPTISYNASLHGSFAVLFAPLIGILFPGSKFWWCVIKCYVLPYSGLVATSARAPTTTVYPHKLRTSFGFECKIINYGVDRQRTNTQGIRFGDRARERGEKSHPGAHLYSFGLGSFITARTWRIDRPDRSPCSGCICPIKLLVPQSCSTLGKTA